MARVRPDPPDARHSTLPGTKPTDEPPGLSPDAAAENTLRSVALPHGRPTFDHSLDLAGPILAGCPIQTWPSANRSAFQIGARAFVSSIA